MSAVCLFTLILCLYGTARTAADGHGVIRRNVGEQVTIQCKSASNQEYLYLKKGLNEEEDIFHLTDSKEPSINQKFTDRLQFHGKLPNVDILIKNLTLNDTGPYWCVYKMADKNYELKATRGNGSVLLVVTDGHGVVQRNVGKQVTIQCRSASTQDMLYLKKSLNEEEDIYFTDSNTSTINQKFTDRLQFHGKLPNVDILINNLTLDDTGLYWCVYKMTDKNYELKATRGNGSVLLVVTENRPSPTVPECEQTQGDSPLVSVVKCTAVLIVVLTAFVIGTIIKNKRNKARRRRDETI